jgi:hypothetical protein
MTIYPIEFHRRLEQKWVRRMTRFLTVTGNATPPRDPNDDDDYEDEERKDEEGPTNRRSCANPTKIAARE